MGKIFFGVTGESMKQNVDEQYGGGDRRICGVDEVGRGPLYGEVVAAAVILPEGFDITEIDDSKKISEKKRMRLAEMIRREAVCGIGVASAEEIDRLNILNATKLAMKRAVENLSIRPDLVLIDALRLEDLGIEQIGIVKGDLKSASIAAASIVAKVYRDEKMKEEGKRYPQYGFESHKGYGTKRHIAAIKQHGLLPLHRRSFLKNIVK